LIFRFGLEVSEFFFQPLIEEFFSSFVIQLQLNIFLFKSLVLDLEQRQLGFNLFFLFDQLSRLLDLFVELVPSGFKFLLLLCIQFLLL